MVYQIKGDFCYVSFEKAVGKAIHNCILLIQYLQKIPRRELAFVLSHSSHNILPIGIDRKQEC